MPNSLFDLADLNTINGFRIDYSPFNNTEIFSFGINIIPDFNGDGFDDLAGVVEGKTNGINFFAGIYLLFSRGQPLKSPVYIYNLDGFNGTWIYCGGTCDSVVGLGDINKDGKGDMLISFYNSSSNIVAYVLFGTNQTLAPSISISSLDNSSRILIIDDKAPEWNNIALGNAGNFTGSGLNSLIIGKENENRYAGVSYLILNNGQAFGSSFSFSQINGSNGVVFPGIKSGEPGDSSGTSVGTVNDIDGNGFDDLIIAAPTAYNYAGQCVIIYGSSQPFNSITPIASLNRTQGVIVNGLNANDILCQAFSSTDFNGDGLKDLILAAPGANNGVGEIYVVFSNKNSSEPPSISNLNGDNGFSSKGLNSNDIFGDSVAGIGDINSDGMEDFIACSPKADGGGQCYAIYGAKGPVPYNFNLADLNGVNGFVIFNLQTGSDLGVSGGGGNVTGSGKTDFVISSSVSGFVLVGNKLFPSSSPSPSESASSSPSSSESISSSPSTSGSISISPSPSESTSNTLSLSESTTIEVHRGNRVTGLSKFLDVAKIVFPIVGGLITFIGVTYKLYKYCKHGSSEERILQGIQSLLGNQGAGQTGLSLVPGRIDSAFSSSSSQFSERSDIAVVGGDD